MTTTTATATYEPTNNPTSRDAIVARTETTEYLVGLDDSNNDPDLDAWVIWTRDNEGTVEHYDALMNAGEIVVDSGLDLSVAAEMAQAQLRARRVI